MRKVDPNPPAPASTKPPSPRAATATGDASKRGQVPEIGGFKGPEPTRYGDWEHNGRCTDF